MAILGEKWPWPLLDGSNYPYWKARIRVFAQALDYDLWSMISEGKPSSSSTGARNSPVPNRTENQQMQSARAMNLLYRTIDEHVFRMVYACKTAKEIWDRLSLLYESAEEKKETLTREYDSFSMSTGESLADAVDRFYLLVTKLSVLGMQIPDGDKVKKVIGFLPANLKEQIENDEKYRRGMTFDELRRFLYFYHDIQQGVHQCHIQ